MKNSVGKPSLFAFQDIITSVIGIFVFISILLVLSISIESEMNIEANKEQQNFSNINTRVEIEKNKEQINALKKLKETLKRQNELEKLRVKRLAAVMKNSAVLTQEIKKLEELLKINPDSQLIKKMLADRTKKIKDDVLAQKRAVRENSTEIAIIEAEISKLKELIKKYTNAIVVQTYGSGGKGERKPLHIICQQDVFVFLATREKVDYKTLQSRLASINKDTYYLHFFFRPSGVNRYFDLCEYCKTNGFVFGATSVLEDENLVYEK